MAYAGGTRHHKPVKVLRGSDGLVKTACGQRGWISDNPEGLTPLPKVLLNHPGDRASERPGPHPEPTPSGDTVKIELTDITPAFAKELLLGNRHNRPLRPKYVDILARDMLGKRWFANGATYKIATDGTVIDGQHRLEAAIKANFTLTKVILVTDLPIEAQATTDIGRGRSASDNLGLSGHKNSAVLASIARRTWQWGQGNIKFHNSLTPTHTEIAKFVEENERIHRSAEIAVALRNSFRPARQSVTGTAHFILLGIDRDMAVQFFAQFANGAGLAEGHPILALRNRFLNDSSMGRTNPFHQDVALTFRAWNALREERSIARLQHAASEPMIMPIS